MKRTVALFISFIMIFSCLAAYGASADEIFDSMFNPVYSGKAHIEFSGELKDVPDALDKLDFYRFGAGIADLKLLAQSLSKSTAKLDAAYNVSKDMRKAKMALKYEISAPITVNESLKIESHSAWSMWIDYDFTSEEPVYKIIYKTPLNKKYTVLDLSGEIDPIELSASMPSEESIKDLSKRIAELYKSCAKVSKQGSGYRLTFDDNGFKLFCAGIFDEITKAGEEQLLKASSDMTGIRDFKDYMQDIKDTFSNAAQSMTILGKGGLVIDLKTNGAGYITAENTDINLSLNIYDILDAFNLYNEESGITKANSNLDLTIKSRASISSHNQNVTVDFPVLTDENSVNPMSLLTPENDYYADGQNKWFSLEYEGLPVLTGNYPLFKLSDICGELGFDVKYENGKAAIDTKTSLGIIEYEANSAAAKANGEEITLAVPPAEIDGSLYISSDGAALMNVICNNISYNANDNKTYIYAYYTDPDYIEPEQEYDEEANAYEYLYVYPESKFFIDGDAFYFPVNAFLGELGVGSEEITEKDGVITVETAKSPVFKRLQLRYGSLFFQKDGGSSLSLKYPVKAVNGEFYVSTDFAELMGYKNDSIDIYAYFENGLPECGLQFSKVKK